MNNRLKKLLLDLDLDEKQADTYLALLELGQATVEEISKKSGIKRTSLYFILENLKKRTLVFESKMDRRTYFEAEKPEILYAIYQDKLNRLSKNMPDLNALYNQKTARARMLFFDSEQGFRQIWRAILNSAIEEYLIITDPKMMLEFVRKNYITNKIIKEKVKKGIKSRQLIYPSEYAKEVTAKDEKENRVSKRLPFDHKIYFTTIIYGESVAFISPFYENIIFIAESKALANTQKALFEALWDKCSK